MSIPYHVCEVHQVVDEDGRKIFLAAILIAYNEESSMGSKQISIQQFLWFQKKKKKMFDLVNFDQILANELDNNEVNILS